MEGFEIWDVIQRGYGQLRLNAAGRILGFDLPSLVTISTALGYDTQALLLLFHYAESGLKEAEKAHANVSHEECISPAGGG